MAHSRSARAVGACFCSGLVSLAIGSAPGMVDDQPKPIILTGRIVEFASKKPIAGATVVASIRELDAPSRDDLESTPDDPNVTTGPDGKFSFPIEADSDPWNRRGVTLSIRHPNYVARRSSRLTIHAIAARQIASLNEIALEPGLEYAIEAVSSEESPVEGVRFELWSQSEENASSEFSNDLRGRTGADGWCKLRMPATWFANVTVTSDSYVPVKHQWDARNRDQFPTGKLPQILGRFVLDRGALLSGRVVGLDGKGIGGIEVQATGQVEGAMRRLTISGPSGEFVFPPMSPGDYLVESAAQSGSEDVGVATGPASTRPIRPVITTLRRGFWSFPVELREMPGVSVRARFEDSSGRPIRGTKVRLAGRCPTNGTARPPRPDADNLDQQDPFGDIETGDESGFSWSISALPDADGRVSIRAPKGLRDAVISTLDVTGSWTFETRMKPRDGFTPSGSGGLANIERDVDGIEFRGYRSPTIDVTVVTEDGRTLPEWINLSAQSIMRKQTHDSGDSAQLGPGRYRITGLLPDRPYTVYAMAQDYLRSRADGIQVPEGGRREVTITLLRPTKPAEVGDLAPPILVTTLDGKPRSLADYAGRRVLVTVWAVNQEGEVITKLKAIHDKFGADPSFAMLSLSYDADLDLLAEKVKEEKMPWPVAQLGGAFEILQSAYGWQDFPTSFLIGPDGTIVAKDITPQDLMGAVSTALKK